MLSEILLFSIKSAFVLALMYVPYTLVLRKESFFRFNRVVLLSILVLALLLPLCNFSALSLDQQPVVHAAQSQMIDVGIPVAQSEDYTIYFENTSNKVSWFEVVGIIYFVGMTIVLMLRVWQLLRMGIVLRRNCVWTRKEDGVIICCHSDDVAPCSWLRCIAISEQDYTNNGREIILHEKGHIINLHSYDILLLTIVQMVQWWNPVSYMLGLSLRDVHEYEADDHVLTEGVSAQAYQMLLIKKAVGSSSYAFANNFNHSLTKKRIAMMINKKSNPWMCTKALYIIPVAFVALSAFATPEFVAPIEEVVSNLEKESAPEVLESIVNNMPIAESVSEEQKEVVSDEKVSEEEITPEVLELMEKIPGISVDDDGTVKINGKAVKAINISGRNIKVNDKKAFFKKVAVNGKFRNNTETTVKAGDVISGTVMERFCGDDGSYETEALSMALVEEVNAEGQQIAKAVSNINGRYELKVVDPSDFIRVTYTGLMPFISPIRGNHFDIVMKEGSNKIEKFDSSDAKGNEPVIFVDGARCKDINSIDKDKIDHVNFIKNTETIKQRFGDSDEFKNGVIEIFTKDYVKPSYPVAYTDDVFDVTEISPEFPGGESALHQFISKNLVYPESCKADKVQGKVTVSAIIEKDGSLSDVKVKRSVNKEIDDEAVRVVKSMPKWTPAVQRAHYVRYRISIPVVFTAPGE